MSKPILEIQHIGKKYRIQQSQQPYISLRDSIGQWFKPKSQSQDFWALNDVSFTVNAGDTIGIIGKNGAGKSTLLKILSRITPPTTGKVISRGRIASLLEVGTGFHPELSGRENVFMNGSILGMRRAEIKTHFDAIVDFAGVAQFIDTPLKHYSSGMQLRLAFAVAAFLQNEILIIDEVLAVGDAEFQKKCLGKMDEVSKSGRTVLFVSHNMGAIKTLCKTSIFLEKGEVKMHNNTDEIITQYFKTEGTTNRYSKNYTGKTQISSCILTTTEENICFELVIMSDKKERCSIDLRIKDIYLSPIFFTSFGALKSLNLINLVSGENFFKFQLPIFCFANGNYFLSVDITEPDIGYFERAEDIIEFNINIPPTVGYNKRLEQKWNYGNFYYPLQQIK